MEKDIVLEGLSAVLGATIKLQSAALLASTVQVHTDVLTVENLLSSVFFGMPFWSDVKFQKDDVQAVRNDLFVMEDHFFDPVWDYDFTAKHDSTKFMRGGHEYKRPSGWKRFALKVLGAYPDGNAWLGSPGHRTNADPTEWPVSYHGTTRDGAEGIIRYHYKAGSRELYGRGVYSTPDVKVADSGYAKTFVSKKNRKTYKVCLQNRINPRVMKVCDNRDYWLVPVPKGKSAEEERDIVLGAIRPYGLLLKEVST